MSCFYFCCYLLELEMIWNHIMYYMFIICCFFSFVVKIHWVILVKATLMLLLNDPYFSIPFYGQRFSHCFIKCLLQNKEDFMLSSRNKTSQTLALQRQSKQFWHLYFLNPQSENLQRDHFVDDLWISVINNL